ncbi:MAG TPA: hypothetical protein VGD29_28315 [Actinoplanes sp.]|jgi:hypothetical protein
MVDPATSPVPAHAGRTARICTILAFAFAVIALFFIPILFGLIAIILGVVAATRGDKPLGWYAAGAGAAGAIIGMILGAIVYSAAN